MTQDMQVDSAYGVVYVTVPDLATAKRLAETVVTEKLAACVNILPGVMSVYRWEGKLEESSELLLIIKTRQAGYAALEARIRALHPYDVPEIIMLPVVAGESAYLAWLHEAVTS